MVKNILQRSQRLFESQQTSILTAASVITAAIFMSALLGLLRNRLIVSMFFQEAQSRAALEAYWVAFRLPDMVFQLLVIGALSAAFIPVYTRYREHNRKEADQLASTLINLIGLVFIALSILIFIFARPLTGLFTGENFTSAQLDLAVNFTRIMLAAQLFFAVSNFLTGIIQAHQRFIIPALAPSAYNLGIILGILLFGATYGVYAACFGVVIGAFLHFFLQLPLAIKLGFRYQPIILWKHKGVVEIIKLMTPRTFALSIEQIEVFVMTYLATTVTLPFMINGDRAGALTIMTLSQQLMSFPVRVFGIPIGQASLPFLSKEASKRNLEQFKRTFINSLHQILFLAMPATAFLIVLRIPAVRIAYGASAFPWAATKLTGLILAILSIAIFAHGAIHLMNRAFYALENTKYPFMAALLSVTLSVSLSYLLAFNTNLGLVGLALASFISTLITACFLLIILHFKVGKFNLKTLLIPPVKMALASAITGVALWSFMRFFDEFLDTTRTIYLIFLTLSVTAIGLAVYIFLSYLLKINQLEAYLKLVDKLGSWRKVLSSSGETIDQTNPTI